MKDFTVQIKRRFVNKNLRDAIELKGFTNDTFGELVGINQTSISMICNFRKNPTEEQKIKMAITLNVPIDDIFPEKYDELYEKISPAPKETDIKIDFVSLSNPEFLMLESENGKYEMERDANASWQKVYLNSELKRIFDKRKSKKDLLVLTMRSQGYTLEEVAKYFGVTIERIRQLEAKCHEIIRQEAPHLAKLIS